MTDKEKNPRQEFIEGMATAVADELLWAYDSAYHTINARHDKYGRAIGEQAHEWLSRRAAVMAVRRVEHNDRLLDDKPYRYWEKA